MHLCIKIDDFQSAFNVQGAAEVKRSVIFDSVLFPSGDTTRTLSSYSTLMHYKDV